MKKIDNVEPYRADFYRNLKEGWNTVTCYKYHTFCLYVNDKKQTLPRIEEFEFGIPNKEGKKINYFSVQIGGHGKFTKRDEFEYVNIYSDKNGDWNKLSDLAMEDDGLVGLKWKVFIKHDEDGYPQVMKFAPTK